MMPHVRNALSRAIGTAPAVLGLIIAAVALTPVWANDLPVVYRGPGAPAAEFESPNTVRIVPGGEIVEISGSFTRNVPQSFAGVLARAPRVRTIRLESPGGLIQPAMEVARIIQRHGLDTYVGRLCASACTLAFLGGHQRLLAANAQLGFHQAHAPNHDPQQADPMLRQAYSRTGVPAAFIDHVLHTPPEALWFPTHNELREAGIVTGEPPRDLLLADRAATTAYQETVKLLRWASTSGVLQFALAWLDLLDQLQEADPELCWEYLHRVPVDLGAHVGRDALDRMDAALHRVRNDVERAPGVGIDAAEKTRVMGVLINSLPPPTQRLTAAALRPEGEHNRFCPAVHTLIHAAMALPARDGDGALRAILSGQ
jgi:hypothetical protein